MALACDIYTTVEDNLWALYRTLAALRQIERDGSPSLINRAFKGFAALPDPNAKKWFEILNVPETAGHETIKLAYFNLARKYHPDNKETGNAELFRQVQSAYELALGRSRAVTMDTERS
jgi:DnaJ-domain-containing protein 1